jgi:hypothetical protein
MKTFLLATALMLVVAAAVTAAKADYSTKLEATLSECKSHGIDSTRTLPSPQGREIADSGMMDGNTVYVLDEYYSG